MTGAEPVTDRRGGDSRARRNAAEMNRQSLKRQTPPTCHCEGASCPWQSREGTCSPYRPPSKRHAPIASVAALTAQPLAALPPYGCGVPFTGGERHAGWHYLRHKFIGARPPSLSFRGAKRRGNLLQPVTFSPRPTCYPTWYCEIATSAYGRLAMTSLKACTFNGAAGNMQLPKALTERRYRRNRCIPFYRRPVPVGSTAPGPAVRSPTNAIGAYRFNGSVYRCRQGPLIAA